MQSSVEKPVWRGTPHGQEFRIKKQSWPERVKTTVGDLFRDIKTANQMAVRQLEETAFQHIAKGGMVMLIGMGFERIIDDVWAEALRGKPLTQRPWIQFGPNTLQRLTRLEQSNPKTYRFVTQFSKDLATGLTYNGLAFFSHQIVPYAESEHLLASMGVNAADALAPDRLRGSESTVVRMLLGGLKYANPPSLLGLTMIIRGGAEALKNIKEVRKVRKVGGGLPGKSVYVPKPEKRYDRRVGEKVYYGRSDKTIQAQEEEKLEKFI